MEISAEDVIIRRLARRLADFALVKGGTADINPTQIYHSNHEAAEMLMEAIEVTMPGRDQIKRQRGESPAEAFERARHETYNRLLSEALQERRPVSGS